MSPDERTDLAPNSLLMSQQQMPAALQSNEPGAGYILGRKLACNERVIRIINRIHDQRWGRDLLQRIAIERRDHGGVVIWEFDDDQTRLYLATLNRLTGEDIPERRALLIGSLLESFEVDDLAGLLPESQDQIAELQRLARVDLDELGPRPPAEVAGAPQVIIEFFLGRDGAKQVNLALDVIAHRHPDIGGRSDALVHLARSYLSASEPSPVIWSSGDAEAGADG